MTVMIHPTADVSDEARIGEGTKVWHQVQVESDAVLGENCVLGKSAYVGPGVRIGNNVKIQNRASIYEGVILEDDVFIGPHVVITNDLTPRAKLWDDSRLVETLVQRGASIGASSTIVCGITLGENCMVGAGSVVTKDVPAHALVYGVPAKIHGYVCECGKKICGPDVPEDGLAIECECGRKTVLEVE